MFNVNNPLEETQTTVGEVLDFFDDCKLTIQQVAVEAIEKIDIESYFSDIDDQDDREQLREELQDKVSEIADRFDDLDYEDLKTWDTLKNDLETISNLARDPDLVSPEFVADIDQFLTLIFQAKHSGLFWLNGRVTLQDSYKSNYLNCLVDDFIECNNLDNFRVYLDTEAIARDLEHDLSCMDLGASCWYILD